jgi:AHBA synthesis associated protein
MEEPFVRESYRLAHRIQLFDGVTEMLRTLRTRGLRMAIATGKAGARARSVLSGLDVLPLFDYVIGSDEVARAKPAPDIVVKALGLLEVQPSEAVMVGDALTDLASARSAGVTGIAALWGTTEERSVLCDHADAALGKPTDLLALCPAVTSGPERP